MKQGYACLQINYRGSVGFGKDFLRKGYKQWSGNMQEDIIDGVRCAIQHYELDESRVCISGGSYGGYAALAGAAFTPEIFKCAIAINGPSNLATFLDNMPPFWQKYKECFYKRFGHPKEDRDLLIAKSPLFSCDKIQCPLLIVQGAKDPRTKLTESEQIVAKLKGHGVRKNQNRLKLYRTIQDFLRQYL